MRFKAKNVAALQTLLGGWPDRMEVEVDPDIGVSAKTVGELRKVTAWPENLTATVTPRRTSGSWRPWLDTHYTASRGPGRPTSSV